MARASPIERSYRVPRRRGRPVLSEVSWPSSRGHSSRRTSPTSLYLGTSAAGETEQEEEPEKRGRGGPFASSNVTSRSFCGCSRNAPSVLRHINSRRRAKRKRRSRDTDCKGRFCTPRRRRRRRGWSRRFIIHRWLLILHSAGECTSSAVCVKSLWHVTRWCRFFLGGFVIDILPFANNW